MNIKIPKHIRLAYVANRLYRRMREGKMFRYDFVRHYRIIKELEKEEIYEGLKGYMINNKVIRRRG